LAQQVKIDEIPPWKQGEKIDICIAHWCLWAPGKSGLYETTKELVMYENLNEGILAGLVVVDKPDGGVVDPRSGLVAQSHEWAFQKANVHMIHYSETPITARLEPRIFFIHGSPEACLTAESHELTEHGRSFTASLNWLQDCEATIVFDKRHYYLWKAFDTENKLHLVKKGIDLKRFHPKGAKMKLDGKPRLLYGEVWRTMKDPFILLYAIEEYYKRNPHVRFHPWGCGQGFRLWSKMVYRGPFIHFLGKYDLSGMQAYPEHWFRGGDIYISPVMIGEPSRSYIEALACGTPTISWDTDSFGDTHSFRYAKPFDPIDMADQIESLWNEMKEDPKHFREKAREIAEEYYDIRDMTAQVLDIVRKVLNKS